MNPSHIIVRQEGTPDQSFPIQRAVLRVGFGAASDVKLTASSNRESTAELAATLRADGEGQWRVYNRGDQDLVVGKQTVPAGQQASWKPGQPLLIEQRHTLQLATEPAPPPAAPPRAPRPSQPRDPQPMPPPASQRTAPKKRPGRPAPPEATSAQNVNPDTEGTDKKKSSAAPIAVVIGCGLLVMMMLLAKRGGSTEETVPSAPSFAAVVELSEDADEDARYLTAKLQIAQANLIRGNSNAAEQQFTRLRKHLSQHRDRFEQEDAQLELEMIRYVEYQLDRLR